MITSGKDDLYEKCQLHAQFLIEKGYVAKQSINDLAEKLYKIERQKEKQILGME